MVPGKRENLVTTLGKENSGAHQELAETGTFPPERRRDPPKLNDDCRFGVNQLDTSYAEQYNTLRSRAHGAVRDPALPIDLAVHSRNLFRSYGYQKLRRFDNGYTDYNYTYYDY
jgi:hypothetical protein